MQRGSRKLDRWCARYETEHEIEVAGEAYAIGEDDYAALERHGFSREDGWDIAAIANFFAMSNRLAGAGDLRPNEEFFALGRSTARPS